MVETTPFPQRRVGGFTLKEIAMVGIPAITYLVAGLFAFAELKSDVRDINTNLTNHKEAFVLVQDVQVVADKAQDVRIQNARDKADKFYTSQEVLKSTTTRTANDVTELKALMNQIARDVQQMARDR